ncbi:hypothetical protein ARMSODRAFT_663810 [Armillaria solidipes]|uniref:PB1 domain-containing protein n=1 Tax=Armillaria solidipes TaxID=1076256 RepID=A0A2H3ARF1_9AGAR|nr:hypothetical protein ARMSODRAFT_663810 [Armillaria solidipes]
MSLSSFTLIDIERSSINQSPTTMSTTRSKFIVVTKDDKNVMFLRKDVSEYEALIASIKDSFPEIHHQTIVIQTRELPVCAGRYVDIPSGLWSTVITDIDNVRVMASQVLTSIFDYDR